MNTYKRYTLVGPGGMKCRCCAPKQTAARRSMKRTAIKRELRDLQRQLNKELP